MAPIAGGGGRGGSPRPLAGLVQHLETRSPPYSGHGDGPGSGGPAGVCGLTAAAGWFSCKDGGGCG